MLGAEFSKNLGYPLQGNFEGNTVPNTIGKFIPVSKIVHMLYSFVQLCTVHHIISSITPEMAIDRIYI